jgi:GT2 family glycosyltransferase
MRRRTSTSVVIPYYDDQPGLDRLFAGLALQSIDPAEPVEVIVADDGSLAPPCIDRCPWACRLVWQPDLGFRAGAARNLGAANSTGDVLVFCDGDMVPAPGWLDALTAPLADEPHALVVGRRRHADLRDLDAASVRRWLLGHEPGPPEIPEPRWLADGYRRTDGLRSADGQSWQLVISASLACRRTLFERLSGFDEAFCHYGGEDWDLAYRAQNTGAVLRHASDAVAWHDGPDWAGRHDGVSKRTEALELALRIPRAPTRPAGWRAGTPAATVELPANARLDTAPWQDAVLALLTGTVATMQVHCPGGVDQLPPWLALDGRVVPVLPVGQWAQRVRLHVWLHRPVALPHGTIDHLLARTDIGGHAAIVVRSRDEALLTAIPTWAWSDATVDDFDTAWRDAVTVQVEELEAHGG